MPTRLAELTTLRLGGPIGRLAEAMSLDDLVETITSADASGGPVLIVSGGSNLVVSDDGWPGLVVLVRNRGVGVSASAERVFVTAAAGERWEELVATTVREGWSGLASMSGIPGLVGATPVQNVGAYGCEVADVLTGLTVLDRETGAVEQWDPQRCGFGFRTSAFKHTDRFVVLEVTFGLVPSKESARSAISSWPVDWASSRAR